ncbi:hypothetical protein Ancab_030912 [Ancistrocladus abbreviatus]
MSDGSESPFSSIESTAGSSLDMSRRRLMLRPRFAVRRRAVPLRRDPRLGGDGRQFICSICGSEFSNNFALYGHTNVHRRPKRRRSPFAREIINLPPPQRSHPTAVADPLPPPPTPLADEPLLGAVRLDEDLWLLPGPPKSNVRPGPRPDSANNGRAPPLAPPACKCTRQLLATKASVAPEVRAPIPRQADAANKRAVAASPAPGVLAAGTVQKKKRLLSPPRDLTRAVRMTALARALKLNPTVRAPAFRPITADYAPPSPPQGFACATTVAASTRKAGITPEMQVPAIRPAAAKRQPVYSRVLLIPQIPPAQGSVLTPVVQAPKLRSMVANNGTSSPPPELARRMPVVQVHAHGPTLTGNPQTPGPVAANNGQPSPPPGFTLRITTSAQKRGPMLTRDMNNPGSVAAKNRSPSPPPGFARRMRVATRVHRPAITHEVQGSRPAAATNGPSFPPLGFGGRVLLLAPRDGPEAPRRRPTAAEKGLSLQSTARARAVRVAPPIHGPVLTLEEQQSRPAAHRRGCGLLIRRRHIDEGSIEGVNPPADWLKLASRGHPKGGTDNNDNLSATTVTDPGIRALHDQAAQQAEKFNLNLELGRDEWQKP